MFMNFTPWLFQHVRYKWNILFYKDNWRGWVEENFENLIDDIEFKYKETWCVHTIGMHCSNSSSSYADSLESSSADVKKPGRLYYCRFCPKFFMRPSFVVRHERIHTGEKPYGCDTCGRFFNAAHAMKRHKSVHSEDKPYKYELCDKYFKTKDNMRVHQTTHMKLTYYPWAV